jgi:hypothetical protein
MRMPRHEVPFEWAVQAGDSQTVRACDQAQGRACAQVLMARGIHGMKATRPLQSIVKKFLLPIAIFSCIAWIAVFVVIYLQLPQRNAGITTLIAISGAVLLFPWLVMVIAVVRRIGRSAGP